MALCRPAGLVFLHSPLSSSNELRAILGCGRFTEWSRGPPSSAVLGLRVLGTHQRVQMGTMLTAFHACLQPPQDLHQRAGMGSPEATAVTRDQRLDTGKGSLSSQNSCEGKGG